MNDLIENKEIINIAQKLSDKDGDLDSIDGAELERLLAWVSNKISRIPIMACDISDHMRLSTLIFTISVVLNIKISIAQSLCEKAIRSQMLDDGRGMSVGIFK